MHRSVGGSIESSSIYRTQVATYVLFTTKRRYKAIFDGPPPVPTGSIATAVGAVETQHVAPSASTTAVGILVPARRAAVCRRPLLHEIFRIQHGEALRVKDRVQPTICTIHPIERTFHVLEDCTLKHRSFSGHGPCGVCTGTPTPTPFEFAPSLT